MAIDGIFDTNALVHTVRNLKVPSQFLLNTFFPNVMEADTDFVSIDVDVGLRRMSPFVSPIMEGSMVEARQFQTNTFKPAYIKDLRTPDFRRPVLRAMGERIGGDMTGEERVQANLAFEMIDQIQMVDRRLEWMAAQALQVGSYTIQGDGFNTVALSFNRASALTVALSGSALWTQANITAGTASPSQNIETWDQLILQKGGASATDIVFTTGAYNAFVLDPRVQQSVWYLRSGESKVDFGGGNLIHGAKPKGEWGGYRLWLYNDWYINSAGVETPMIAGNQIIMTSSALEGVRAFGMILDDDFAYKSLAYAPKSWVPPNPARRHLLMQSAPVVIPSRVNASFAATVA